METKKDELITYLLSTNKNKLHYAKTLFLFLRLPRIKTTIIPIPPLYNGESVDNTSFIGPLTKEQTQDRPQKENERPTQPWGEDQTKDAAIKRSDKPHNTISIENGLEDMGSYWVDFVVVRLFIYGKEIIMKGGRRTCKSGIKTPIGDEHFNVITRHAQFYALINEHMNVLPVFSGIIRSVVPINSI